VTIERVVRVLRAGNAPSPPSIDAAKLERQKRELALAHAAGRITDDAYLSRMAQLRRMRPVSRESASVSADVAVKWLRDIPGLWRSATEEARGELLRAIYDRIEVTREGFRHVRLTAHAYRHGLALAMPETVVARPAGFEPATWWSEATRSIH
jgi:hypothetical protein